MLAPVGRLARTHSRTASVGWLGFSAVACRLQPTSTTPSSPYGSAITCTPSSFRSAEAAARPSSIVAPATCRLKLVTYGIEPTTLSPQRGGSVPSAASEPKSGGSSVVGAHGPRTDLKKEVPRRVSRSERPARAPYISTGQPSSPIDLPSDHASASHSASSASSSVADASESGMKATMSSAPCRGCGAGCGCVARSTDSSASAAASAAASSSGARSATSLTDDLA